MYRRELEEHVRFRINTTILMRQVENAHTTDENMQIFYADDVERHYSMATVNVFTVQQHKDFIRKEAENNNDEGFDLQ